VAQSLLAAIKPANRNAFVLRELEGLEYTDVGKALRISPLAARVRVSRARKEMHHQLRHYFQPGLASMRRPAMAVA
jgi:DNA-directed RNA polymerase specialized sigma24 family protein